MDMSTELNVPASEGHQEFRAESERLAQQRAAHLEAIEALDADFHAIRIIPDFRIRGTRPDGEELEVCAEFPPDHWAFSDDAAENARLTEDVLTEVRAVFDPLIAHFRSMGLVRADFVSFGGRASPRAVEAEPLLFLVHNAVDADVSAYELFEMPHAQVELASVKGAILTTAVHCSPVNATMLFEQMQRGAGGAGIWGGDATPELDPVPGESRDEWLERVSVPRERLARLVERQRRSGGNIRLFKAVGAASGQVAKERPIKWIVPGLIPRGYVSLLVGTKQAGKSTLLGELLAVVDSECQSPRFVLGTEVTARGASAFVSGEDGYDFVASRNAYYEPVHGEAQGFVFVTAEEPWAEVLKLLYDIPRGGVSVIGIDGLRAVMPGDEDSSGAISQFFDELNALAQYHNCAIVLIHHLSKAAVRSLSGMLQAVRGSGAITDRVRVAIGMIYRASGTVEVGIIKHNIPPSETVWGEVNAGRLFHRDANMLTLVPVDADVSAAKCVSNIDLGDAILEAIGHFNKHGVVLRRTGRHELFEQRPPELAGVSRSAIRDGVALLLEAGRIADGPHGLHHRSKDAAGD